MTESPFSAYFNHRDIAIDMLNRVTVYLWREWEKSLTTDMRRREDTRESYQIVVSKLMEFA